ncbi:MAG: DUF305 domain-containing protein [Gemmatimonadales bacterium]
MAPPRFTPLATRLLLLPILAGCAGRSQGAAPASTPPASRYPSTEADARFMSAMIGHHRQAIVMAGWAPTHGAGAAVSRLAERIAAGQRDEIATMQQWLRDRDLPVPEGHQAAHGQLMAGMLTEAQMSELEAARGPAFDRLFLTGMIQHHRGAVTMVKQLFGTPGAAREQTVFKFANDVSVDQSTEIARMERMLSALSPGEPSS